jgi:hypothetical protein
MGYGRSPGARSRSGATLGLLFLTAAAASGACATDRSATGASAGTGSSAQRRERWSTIHEAVEPSSGGGLEMRAEHGIISQEDAEDAVRARWRELSRCYEAAGASRDFAGGAVRLRFRVGLDGHTTEAHVLESRLGSFEVERCLVDVGRTITFPRPQGGAVASVEYSMEFRSTGELPVVDLPEGELDAQLPGALRKLAADCERLGADALTVTLYVDHHGAVRSVGMASSTPVEPEAAACVARSLRGWSVALPVDGRTLARATVTLRNQDVLEPPPPPRSARTARLTSGRRPGRGRH